MARLSMDELAASIADFHTEHLLDGSLFRNVKGIVSKEKLVRNRRALHALAK
jgi:hypothetical protein